jgi:hypothetical protein
MRRCRRVIASGQVSVLNSSAAFLTAAPLSGASTVPSQIDGLGGDLIDVPACRRRRLACVACRQYWPQGK